MHAAEVGVLSLSLPDYPSLRMQTFKAVPLSASAPHTLRPTVASDRMKGSISERRQASRQLVNSFLSSHYLLFLFKQFNRILLYIMKQPSLSLYIALLINLFKFITFEAWLGLPHCRPSFKFKSQIRLCAVKAASLEQTANLNFNQRIEMHSMQSLGATRTTTNSTAGQMSISPTRGGTISVGTGPGGVGSAGDTISSGDQPLSVNKKSKNIMEWRTSTVCEFLQEILSGRHQDVIRTIQSHQVSGVDLVEMTEQNLIELGIPTMHERKQVLRAIRQSRNDPQSTYGKFKVRMLNPGTKKYQEVILKVSDNETKVKHILKQAFQVFTKAKCETSDFCLAKISSNSKTKSILSNETIFLSLLHENSGGSLDLFEIFPGGEFVTQTSVLNGTIHTISAESPSSILLPKEENTSLEQILQSPPDDPSMAIDTLMDDQEPLFDNQDLLIPSFIENKQQPLVGSSDLMVARGNNAQISRSHSGGGAPEVKLKVRIGSANLNSVLKEKLQVKRQQQNRNQNASQMNSQGSQEGNAGAQQTKKSQIQLQQPYSQGQQQQKQRNGSQTSQERFLGASLNVVSQQRTFDNQQPRNVDGTCKIRIVQTNQRNGLGIGPQSQHSSNQLMSNIPDGGKTLKRKQPSVTKTPVGSVLGTSFSNQLNCIGSTSNLPSGQNKPLAKANHRQGGLNMFQTMNEILPQGNNRIQHNRNSSKTSCLLGAPSEQTTERNKLPFQQPQQKALCGVGQNQRSGTRQQFQNINLKTFLNEEESADQTQDLLKCSLEVQNTIQTVAGKGGQAFINRQQENGVSDLNQILSEFLNEQKINVNIQQQNQAIKASKHKESSQSRQQQQQLLEQDSLESKFFEDEYKKIQQNQRYDLVESSQAYFNEQESLLNPNFQEQQLIAKTKTIKHQNHIQTKSMHAFAALTNQKKQAVNVIAKNQLAIKRQNYVNSYQTPGGLTNGGCGMQETRSTQNILYGTFDNTLRQKHQNLDCNRCERGSSVGCEQFYTIDNTVPQAPKDNFSQLNSRVVDSAALQQHQKVIRKQEHINEQQKINIHNQSHLKIKGLKIKGDYPHQPQQTGCVIGGVGLQKALTMTDNRIRSNSNNARQLVNNRYGEKCDDMHFLADPSSSHSNDEL